MSGPISGNNSAIGGGRNNNTKVGSLKRRISKNDPELERIYGTAKGMADMTMLSDWEKDS